MPAYDYDCPSCGRMEIWHRMTESVAECPHCGAAINRVIHAPSFRMDDDWSSENGGRGKYRGDFAEYPGDPKAYMKSRSEFIDTLKRTGTPYATGV